MDPSDEHYMRRALELAEQGWGRVHPNPLVGAVVVKGGGVVGEGFHAEFGQAHAESVALAAAGNLARGATIYVTLEPCTHVGQTPPCTEGLVAAGVARVVYAAEDPDPVAGGGAELLRRAGIEVLGGVERAAARRQNASFFFRVERRAPFVALKYGLSLDARLGESWDRPTAVTGQRARDAVQRLRAGFDSILVGIGTVHADDPLLTVRGAIKPRRPPVRLVLDSQASLPLDCRLLRTIDEALVYVFCAEDAPVQYRDALARAGARVALLPRGDDGCLAPAALLDQLWSEGIYSVLCEGGGRLGGSLLANDRIERLYLYYAPCLFGEAGPPAFPARPPDVLRRGWRLAASQELEGDLLIMLDRER